MLTKQELLHLIAKMPDDIDVFVDVDGYYGEVDIRIFTESKDSDFYDWYFGV